MYPDRRRRSYTAGNIWEGKSTISRAFNVTNGFRAGAWGAWENLCPVGKSVARWLGFWGCLAGPLVLVPADTEIIQFTSLVCCRLVTILRGFRWVHTSFAVVPESVRGSQMYVDAPRFVDTQRSPMYLPAYQLPLTTKAVQGRDTCLRHWWTLYPRSVN